MYVCGVTVYNKAHIGHAMFALVFDVLRRYLTYRGYEVRQVINFTDVDDKIINRANQMGMDASELAENYINEFRAQIEALNILPATVNPRATLEMPQIIQMIEGLIEKGYAYPAEGDVYFRVTRDEDYGKLSGRKLEDMQAGSRIDIGEIKENPMDFALWKAAKPGEPFWKSPWGPGRPGWHIECSAMNLSHLGEQIDIHGGGNDLIFPHHENEIAQTESYTGKPFARYWVHNGMLQLGGEKMSKSLGNLVTIEDFFKKHDADVLRMMVLNSGYRNPLTYTDEVVEQTERALERLKSGLRAALPGAKGLASAGIEALAKQVEARKAGFIEMMDDDFNTSGGLATCSSWCGRSTRRAPTGRPKRSWPGPKGCCASWAGCWGCACWRRPGSKAQAAAPFIDLLIEVRRELRKQKLWALSDLVRDRLPSWAWCWKTAKKARAGGTKDERVDLRA